VSIVIPGAPSPKFATERNPDRPTLGTLQRRFADVWLGPVPTCRGCGSQHGLMPWQGYVADVAGELVQDAVTGLWRPAYPLVVVTVPRQAGKSHLAAAQVGERCFSVPMYRAWYTAQTGGDARDQFLKFADETLEGTPLASVVRTLRGNGHEAMRYPNGSTWRPHPPTEAAMHGKQSDREDIDEGWAFEDVHGQKLLQAIAPTQLTRPMAQTYVWSAGGTAASTWLAELVARGRGGDPSMAFFEWGIPDDLDVDDLEAVAAHHPAVGHTMDLHAMRTLRTMLPDDAEFARAAGNRWTEVIGGAIPADQWSDARHLGDMPEGATAWGAARALDGSHVAVVAATELPGGEVLVELVDLVPAHDAAAAVARWAGTDTLAVSRSGASGPLADDLELVWSMDPDKLLRVTTQAEAAACGRVSDLLAARSWKFRPHPELDKAREVTGKRRTTGGGFVWAATGEGAPIAALEAATWATHALRHARPTGLPMDRWAS
jgi:hypothetical protein